VVSGLGAGKLSNLVVLPVLFEGDVMAVIELASLEAFSDIHLLFLDQLRESIGIVLNTIGANMRTEELLKQSQSLTAELQLRQEELQKTNLELEEKARLLSDRNEEVERRTREIDQARSALEQKAEQLALTSKYKSQFLANMSHELRTPLNSLLILSKQLANNPEDNLTSKQVEFASTIHAAGTDLLTLINDILDLSKIESGTTTIDIADVAFKDIRDYTERTFRQLANDRGLVFAIELDPALPPIFRSDMTRLQQVLKNLLSNAFKFTSEGSVQLRIFLDHSHKIPGTSGPWIAFEVSDSGIGIPPDKQRIIFEAFQQADMTTARKYGGTGLGLAISREIARLLGGEIAVQSTPGVGSTFTLYHPTSLAHGALASSTARTEPAAVISGIEEDLATRQRSMYAPGEIFDDRAALSPRDRVILVVEDDPAFARILLDVARSRGFKGVVAHDGASAIALTKQYRPDAITIDIKLPDIDGWELIERLHQEPDTAAIPIHVISGQDQNVQMTPVGLVTQLQKPVSVEALESSLDDLFGFVNRSPKNVLVIEDDLTQLNALTELIQKGEVSVTAVQSGGEALGLLEKQHFHCIILDLGLPDVDGTQLLRDIRQRSFGASIPIIIYTGKDLSRAEESVLGQLSETIIVKDAHAPERLLDELGLFLHQVQSTLPSEKRRDDDYAQKELPALTGRKVLVVDDDLRNILALTTALQSYHVDVVPAENGQLGIKLLNSTPGIDAVLMDIMMPEMDGFETMRRIRANPNFSDLPIIALTAKAMKGDRDSCIEAGASDYISKPVDIEKLVGLLRVWLSR